MIGIKKFVWLLTLILVLGFGVMASTSDEFPSKPIKIINSFAPGGTTDVSIRALTATASEFIRQPIVHENITGAGGVTGFMQVIQAKGDGYTLAVADNVILTLPLFVNVPFSYKDFKPICIYQINGIYLVTNARKPWKTLEDFIAEAKRRPGEITVGVPGKGSPQELAVAALEQSKGIDVNIIPYAGGATVLPPLLGGQIDAAMFGFPMGFENVKNGDLRILATTLPFQLKDYTEHVPTYKELGIPYELVLWKALWTPKSTPDSIVARLADIFRAMAKHPKFIEFAKTTGAQPTWMGPDEFKEFLERENKMLKELKSKM